MNMTFVRKLITVTVAYFMILLLAGHAAATEADHVVKASELHQSLLEAAQGRQANLEKVQSFFFTEPGKRALQHSGTSPAKVVQAVASLDSEELEQLAARVDKVNKDFAAGALSNQQLTYIVIALATAVLILVIVAA
jgi:hypothetical protein